MAILQLPQNYFAQNGILPSFRAMVVTDNLATVTAAGYLNENNLGGYTVSPNDVIEMFYNFDASANTRSYGEFTVSISSGIITLMPDESEGNVVLPVTVGDFAIFADTTGKIKDSGFKPSDVTKTNVSMSALPTVAGNLVEYIDVNGTLQDTGFSSANIQPKSNIRAGVSSAIHGSGTGPYNIPVSGVSGTSPVFVTIVGTANSGISIVQQGGGTNTITLTLSGDPGGFGIVNWMAFLAPQ